MKTFYLVLGLIIIFLMIWFGFVKRSAPVEVVPKITYLNASADSIVPTYPTPGLVTSKEFSITGMARGGWYFEASFPFEVLDPGGKQIAVSFAQAQGEWMTTEFVPFKGEIKIPATYSGPATLVLHKDNPSDMREYDASISFPIIVGN